MSSGRLEYLLIPPIDTIIHKFLVLFRLALVSWRRSFSEGNGEEFILAYHNITEDRLRLRLGSWGSSSKCQSVCAPMRSKGLHSSILLWLLLLSNPTNNCCHGWSSSSFIQNAIINYIKSSNVIATLHEEHVNSNQVQHMMKSTPLVNAPDDAKMDFANGIFGKMLADIMQSEQLLLGDWKIDKIVEAAGQDFNEDGSHLQLMDMLNEVPVTVFSFVDCPWCLLAKKLLQNEHHGILQIIELEDLGRKGKQLRASIALSTGRTSMPAIFINNKSIGGYTDGFGETTVSNSKDEESISDGFTYVPPIEKDLRLLRSPGLAALHESGELAALLRDAQR